MRAAIQDDHRGPGHTAARVCFWGLRVAPWLVFGPITGLMTERAIYWHRKGDKVLAGLYVLANISVLVAIPSLTALVARQI